MKIKKIPARVFTPTYNPATGATTIRISEVGDGEVGSIGIQSHAQFDDLTDEEYIAECTKQTREKATDDQLKEVYEGILDLNDPNETDLIHFDVVRSEMVRRGLIVEKNEVKHEH